MDCQVGSAANGVSRGLNILNASIPVTTVVAATS